MSQLLEPAVVIKLFCHVTMEGDVADFLKFNH